MADLTYTAIGTFDGVSGNMSLDLMIPEENPLNQYEFDPQYDFSRTINDDKDDLNCILCVMKLKNDDGLKLFADKYNFPLEIINSSLTSYSASGRIAFKPADGEALFLLFHVNDLAASDLAYIYANVEDYYIQAKNNGSFQVEINSMTAGRPKVVGACITFKQ